MLHYIYYGDNLQQSKNPFITVYEWDPQYQHRNYLQHIGKGRFVNENLQVDIPNLKLLDKRTKDVYTLIVCEDPNKPSLQYRSRMAYNMKDQPEWEEIL